MSDIINTTTTEEATVDTIEETTVANPVEVSQSELEVPGDNMPDTWSAEIENSGEYSKNELFHKYGNSVLIHYDDRNVIDNIYGAELHLNIPLFGNIYRTNTVPDHYAIVDRGHGQKYTTPSLFNKDGTGYYLEKGLYDFKYYNDYPGFKIFNYKFVDGQIVERTVEEKADDTNFVLANIEINKCRANLTKTDYVTIKIAEGKATTEDYADILAQRDEWRAKINELQEKYNISN